MLLYEMAGTLTVGRGHSVNKIVGTMVESRGLNVNKCGGHVAVISMIRVPIWCSSIMALRLKWLGLNSIRNLRRLWYEKLFVVWGLFYSIHGLVNPF